VPELPEVENVRRQLERLVVGATITSTTSRHTRYQVPDLGGALVEQIRRRGKYLLVDIADRGVLMIHLGMTGQLLWESDPGNHVHFELATTAGTLRFRDTRRFGTVRLVEPGDRLPATLRQLGQEPGDGLDVNSAANQLMRGSAPLKARLLEQRSVAGVGNYLADEALHASKLHPASRSLTTRQARRLIRCLNEIMVASVEHGGVSERDYVHVDGGRGSYQNHLRCYGRSGMPCLTCSTPLSKIVVAGRGSTFCPKCQQM
jgi:formamidopyrimidine-DNA glycosylase